MFLTYSMFVLYDVIMYYVLLCVLLFLSRGNKVTRSRDVQSIPLPRVVTYKDASRAECLGCPLILKIVSHVAKG